jgi:hypothetical protein
MSVGRLDVDEYGERSAEVATAKTRGELAELFTDLPEPHPKFGIPAVAAVEPAKSAGSLTWSDRTLTQRLVAALMPLCWVAGVVLFFTVGGWWWFALPFALTAVGRGLWGSDWEAEQRTRRHRRKLRDRRGP